MDKRFWVVVPAAGSARRMGAAVPKQYLPLAGRTVIEWSLAPFLAHARTAAIVVVLAEQDQRWPQIAVAGDAKIATTTGGAERMDSVLAGLRALQDRAAPDDWVLVHDAARPCLSVQALDRLITEAGSDETGGLLAIPVADTLKREDGKGCVSTTERREGLWQAQTPQMFRQAALRHALQLCGPAAVTDEAGAIEKIGACPRLVMGESRNIKVTYPDDLELAGLLLDGIERAGD